MTLRLSKTPRDGPRWRALRHRARMPCAPLRCSKSRKQHWINQWMPRISGFATMRPISPDKWAMRFRPSKLVRSFARRLRMSADRKRKRFPSCIKRSIPMEA